MFEPKEGEGGIKKVVKIGPSTITVPAKQLTCCNGCLFLHTQPMLRGHACNTNNYVCVHEDFASEILRLISDEPNGRLLYYNRKDPKVVTPAWCPFIRKESETTQSS